MMRPATVNENEKLTFGYGESGLVIPVSAAAVTSGLGTELTSGVDSEDNSTLATVSSFFTLPLGCEGISDVGGLRSAYCIKKFKRDDVVG